MFHNGAKDRMKLLLWDRNGFWTMYKRLEQGTFPFDVRGDGARVEIYRAQLSILLEGSAMERALDLSDEVAALHALVITHRQWFAERDEKIAHLEQQNRVRAKMVFRHSSEKRPVTPMEPGLQGHLFLADIAAEAERLAEAHRVVATVEVPAHTRTVHKCRGKFPAHLPLVRTVCELEDEDRVCACGGELKAFGEETSRAAMAVLPA